MTRHSVGWLIIFLWLAIALAACSPGTALLPSNDSRLLHPGSTFGQSFTARYNGLSGVSIFLAPSTPPGSGSLLFHLREISQPETDLVRARLPVSEITNQSYYMFDFSPQPDSFGKDYFVQVDFEGNGQVLFFTAPADSYLDGALYENDFPQEAQLGFRLEYERGELLLGLVKLFGSWLGVLAVGLFALILPGWAIFSFFWRDWDNFHWGLKLGLSGGLSLAIYPLFILWSGVFGLHLGVIYAWLPPLVGIILLLLKHRKFFLNIKAVLNIYNLKHKASNISTEILIVELAFIIVLGLVIVSRLWVIRTLDIPLYGDSYQHTMIAQLLIDHRGLFTSWLPYADLRTFTYHYGFHSIVAVYHWITGASTAGSMLWAGQLINILAVIGLYPLAYIVTKNRWAGVIAILIGGMLSPMPMSYVNWGRYTQLAGQAILPVCIWTTWVILERPIETLKNIPWIKKFAIWHYLSIDPGSLAIVWLVLGGLALTHYRILILIVLFFPAFFIMRFSLKKYMVLSGRIAWIGVGSLILFLPWFIRVFGGKILNTFAAQISTSLSTNLTGDELFIGITDFRAFFPLAIWVLFFICLGWGLVKRHNSIAIFALWWFFILLATNPNWIGLPGFGVITNFAVFIAFYIPVAVTIASVVASHLRDGQQNNNDHERGKISTIILPGVILLLVCSFGIWGLRERVDDLDTQAYELVTRPDLRAMEWIRSNVPSDARFLINSFPAYGNTSIVGSDAGWWIPLLAQRKNTVPPLTYAAEQGTTPAYSQNVMDFYYATTDSGITSPQALRILREQGIDYVYIGQRQGRVNYSGSDVLDPTIISDDQNFDLIYHQDRVWVYKIKK